jgi:hypothetical protein
MMNAECRMQNEDSECIFFVLHSAFIILHFP